MLTAVSAKAPDEVNVAASAASQLSLLATVALPLSKLSRGSASTPVTPNALSVGPTARTSICFEPVPLRTKPGIGVPASPPRATRVAMLISRAVPEEPRDAEAVAELPTPERPPAPRVS